MSDFIIGEIIGCGVMLAGLFIVLAVRYRRLCRRLDKEEREFAAESLRKFDAFVAELDRKYEKRITADAILGQLDAYRDATGGLNATRSDALNRMPRRGES